MTTWDERLPCPGFICWSWPVSRVDLHCVKNSNARPPIGFALYLTLALVAIGCVGCKAPPPTSSSTHFWRSGDAFESTVNSFVSRFAAGDGNAIGDLAEWLTLSDTERADDLSEAVGKCWEISAERMKQVGRGLPRRYQEHLAMALMYCTRGLTNRTDVSKLAHEWEIDEGPLLEYWDSL